MVSSWCLLGPSGSGKSTLLRAIAGLTEVDHGRVSLHGRDVTHTTARQREVGFVFQHYALFRHMTDRREHRVRAARPARQGGRAGRRRKELLRLVASKAWMTGCRPSCRAASSSASQCTCARTPAEGAADGRAFRRTRREDPRGAAAHDPQIQRELGITTILVTHDQEEAFALADRIGVMNQGRLLECGRPDDLYTRPQTRFVATSWVQPTFCSGIARARACGSPSRTAPTVGAMRRRRNSSRCCVPRSRAGGHGARRQVDAVGQATVEEVVFGGSVERLRVG
jgi:ABC-type Fe3+/spermidine/putrescine transport system ATPase subunit